MSDAGWNAIKDIAVALFSFLAVLFAKQARDLGQQNADKIDATSNLLANHDEASALRSRELKQELSTERRLRPPAPESDVREP